MVRGRCHDDSAGLREDQKQLDGAEKTTGAARRAAEGRG
jgi:hypothetical protein